jgi:hypothetical protein
MTEQLEITKWKTRKRVFRGRVKMGLNDAAQNPNQKMGLLVLPILQKGDVGL